MKRKIRLTESEFHNLVRKLVKETQHEMNMEGMYTEEDGMNMEGMYTEEDEMDMDMEDEMDMDMEDEEMGKGEVVDLISKFFKREILPDLDRRETISLTRKLGQEAMSQLSEMYLNEDISSRMSNFKEKAMMRGGLGVAAMGAIGALGEITGYSEHELTSRIHDFVESFGAGHYSGPITVAMVAAGLALAIKGMSNRYSRTGK